MEQRTLRQQSEHHYNPRPTSLPSLHEAVHTHQVTQHSPTNSISHPPLSLSSSNHSHPHRPATTQPPPFHPPPYGHQPPYTPTSRPDRILENGIHRGEGSGNATPVNVHPLEVQSAPGLHTPTETKEHPAASMHHPADRHPEGPPSAPPGGYPHAGPYQPPPYNPPLSMQMAQHDSVPLPQQVVEHGGYSVQHQPHPGYSMNAYGMYPPYSTAISNSSSGTKKKGHRASQACEKCRERKSKCDENRPTCQGCQDQNIECVYRDAIPSKTVDKSLPPVLNEMQDVLSRLPGQHQVLVDLLKHLERHQDDWFDRIERFMQGASLVDAKREEIARMDTPTGEKGFKTESFQTNAPLTFDRSMSTNSQATIPAHSNSQVHPKAAGMGANESEPLPDFDEHTTAAHKLLYLWPTVKDVVGSSFSNQGDYVLKGEARGLLRLSGRGEELKPKDHFVVGHTAAPQGTAMDETGDANSTPPLLWDECYPTSNDPRKVDAAADSQPLDLREDTVMRLVAQYQTHIHDLHPFLDFPTLTRYVQIFIDRHRHFGNSPSSPYANANGECNRKKRKRSEPFPNGSDSPAQTYASPSNAPPNDESLAAAVTYLVLALGKIAQHQDMIPGPVPDMFSSSMPPPKIPYSPYASKPSPASSWNGAPTPSSQDGRSFGQSPTHSFDSPAPPAKRLRGSNVDEIPGLDYYREGCRILGLHNDSNDITNAQARLLAGLYKGQLGRVQESWSWISDATRICRYQIRMNNLDKGGPTQYVGPPLDTWQGAYQNTVLITCWSALQLESDILAEMDYPHSGLATVQDAMPYPITPNVPPPAGRRMTPMKYYSLQLYLRKLLNQMHSNVYGKALPSSGPKLMTVTLESNEQALSSFRRIHDWDEDEPPAKDILEARIRGKFYGARYICLRPYLDYVLHAMRKVQHGETLAACARDGSGRLRINDLKIYGAIATMSEDHIIDCAKRCVESAILSTEAFDGVEGRLIVTNIIGTSHAQFSNMLVLSAAYHAGPPEIRELIPAPRLKALLFRTIQFISNLQLCSPTATHDVKILRAIYKFFFRQSAAVDLQDMNGSFSSEMSG